jgi:hypothetical protein
MKRFVARALIVVAAILGMMFAQVAPASAGAPDDPSGKLTRDLAALWTAVLQTDASENPAVNEDAGPACWDLGHRTVAQFGFVPNEPCTVKPGIKIFVAAYSGECSTFDNDCGLMDNPPEPCGGTTAPDLLACTKNIDAAHSPANGLTVTVDGKPLPLTEVDVPKLNIELPDYNIFDVLNGQEAPDTPGGKGLSAAHGWVALLNPLTPGSHEIVITDPVIGTVTTTIIVTKGP